MDLFKEKANLEAQRDNAYAAYQQSIGALALIDILLKEEQEKLAETITGMISPE